MKPSITPTVQATLADAIRSREWSQRKAAVELGISQPNLCDLLGGRVDPRLSTVERLCGRLGLKLVLADAPPARPQRPRRRRR